MVTLANRIEDSTKFELDQNKDFREVEQRVFSLAKEMEACDLVGDDKKSQTYYPTSKLEKEVERILNHYDECVFWEKLSSRLTRRDMLQKFGPVEKKSEDQLNQAFEVEEKYRMEFTKKWIGESNFATTDT